MASELPSKQGKTWLGYGIIVAATALGFAAIRSCGATLRAPPPSAGPSFADGKVAHSDTLLHVLLALLVIVAVARLLRATTCASSRRRCSP